MRRGAADARRGAIATPAVLAPMVSKKYHLVRRRSPTRPERSCSKSRARKASETTPLRLRPRQRLPGLPRATVLWQTASDDRALPRDPSRLRVATAQRMRRVQGPTDRGRLRRTRNVKTTRRLPRQCHPRMPLAGRAIKSGGGSRMKRRKRAASSLSLRSSFHQAETLPTKRNPQQCSSLGASLVVHEAEVRLCTRIVR